MAAKLKFDEARKVVEVLKRCNTAIYCQVRSISSSSHVLPNYSRCLVVRHTSLQVCQSWSQRHLHRPIENPTDQIRTAFTGPLDEFSGFPLTDPEKGEIAYSGPLTKMVKAVKLFSLTTSCVALCLQPYLLLQTQDLVARIAVGSFMGLFILGTPAIMHFVSRKYVTALYFNRDRRIFTAYTFTLFARPKELTFKASDVVIPNVPGLFTFLLAKGKPLFMDSRMFKNNEAYVHLMGYDKPMDWEMPSNKENM